jgi:hypothetical protein
MIGGQAAAGNQFSAVQSLIDLALVNQARQLGLDLAPRASAAPAPATPAAAAERPAAVSRR